MGYYAAVTVDNTKKTYSAGTLVSISSPAEWNMLASLVSSKGNWAASAQNVTFFLTADLDFSTVAAKSVGIKYGYYKTEIANGGTHDASNVSWMILSFQGIFDGNGHTISNAVMSVDPTAIGQNSNYRGANIGMGLFSVTSGATIKNLIIDESCSFVQTKECTLGGYLGAGALIGITAGKTTVENVWNKAYVYGGTHGAGIIGRMDSAADVINCTNSGTIEGANAVGGITGWTNGLTATGCVNNGIIYGHGGIGGRAKGNSTFTECVNNGMIIGDKSGKDPLAVRSDSNGIVGNVEGSVAVTITRCINNAKFNLGYFASADSNKCYRGIVNCGGDYDLTNGIVVEDCYSVLEPFNYDAYVGYNPSYVIPVDLTDVANIVDYNADDVKTAYQITDVAGLTKLSELVAASVTFANITIYLATDLDLSGVTFTPIGYYTADNANCKSYGVIGTTANPFKGIFDGQGHTIDGLQMSYTNTQRSDAGLFGYISSGTVKNLIIGANSYIQFSGNDGYTGVGAFSGRGGAFYNCASYATVDGGDTHTGGIVGRDGSAIKNCSNYGAVINGGYTGGIGGFQSANYTLCANYGVVKGTYAGGMNGVIAGASTLTCCANYGTISGDQDAAGAGVARSVAVTLDRYAQFGSIGTRTGFRTFVDLVYKDPTGESYNPTVTEENCIVDPTVGYSDKFIPDVDLTYVPDITDLYTIVEDGTYDVETFGTNGVSNDPPTYTTIAKGVFQKIDENAPDSKVLKITDAAGWRLFSAFINSYDDDKGTGMTFYLANDIDMSGYKQTLVDITLCAADSILPVGWERTTSETTMTDDCAFKGVFNGLGNSISNLVMKGGNASQRAARNGVFGKVNGIVSNLVVESSCNFSPETGVGAVAGGIASASNNATITNTWNKSNIQNGLKDVVTRQSAGIVANVTSSFIANSTNSGWMAAMNYVGGIVANVNGGRVTIANCRNLGTIASARANSQQGAAGIVGRTIGQTGLVNCENYGTVITSQKTVAGIVNIVDGSNTCYNNCYNYGLLDTSNAAEGVVLDTQDIVGYTISSGEATQVSHLSKATTQDTAYSEEMLYVWYQTNAAGDVRLVTTVDSLNYDYLVLTITREDGAVARVGIGGVYTSVLANDYVTTTVEHPANWGADTSLYFGAFTITDAAGQTFTVQATAYLNGQVVHTGAERTVTVPAVA